MHFPWKDGKTHQTTNDLRFDFNDLKQHGLPPNGSKNDAALVFYPNVRNNSKYFHKGG